MIQTRTSQHYTELVQLATPQGQCPATAKIELISLQKDDKLCWHVLITLSASQSESPQVIHSSYFQAHEIAKANNRVQLYKYLLSNSSDLRINPK